MDPEDEQDRGAGEGEVGGTPSRDAARPPAPARDPLEIAQRERARQSWSLAIDAAPEALSEGERRGLLRTLRVKRSERAAFLARLPGVVRRGARVDLEDLQAGLRAEGLPARLFRTPDRG